MSDPLWLSPDISAPLMSPLRNLPNERSGAALRAVVDQFDVEHAERYRVRDITGDGKKETFCNIFVSDVTRAFYCEIPHRWNGKWLDVRGMAEYVNDGMGAWKKSESWQAQAAADKGHPAIVVYDPPERAHGHIAMIVPSDGQQGVWIAQAGARCWRRAPIMAGFGIYAKDTQFFAHP